MTLFLGIDPGIGGGIALVGEDHAECWAMPETEREVWELIAEHKYGLKSRTPYSELEDATAVIERVHAMPRQGVSSTFKFGMNYGFLRCCLIAAEIPFEAVSPTVWQREMGIPARGEKTQGQHKKLLRQKAQEMFPKLKVTNKTCDALLIATWAARRKQ